MPSRDTKTEEKSGIAANTRVSGARLTSTKLSRPHLPPWARYPSTCTCSLGHIRCHQLSEFFQRKVGSNNPDFHSTSPSYHDSGQPRLSSGSRRNSSAVSVIIRQSSAVRTHISEARAVEWMRVGDQKRDQTFRWWSEFFSPQNCVRKRTCRWSRGVHSELWMTPSPFYKRAVVLNDWCFRNILTTARLTVMQPHTHHTLDQVL